MRQPFIYNLISFYTILYCIISSDTLFYHDWLISNSLLGWYPTILKPKLYNHLYVTYEMNNTFDFFLQWTKYRLGFSEILQYWLSSFLSLKYHFSHCVQLWLQTKRGWGFFCLFENTQFDMFVSICPWII